MTPITPLGEDGRGTWVVAVQLIKNEGATTTHSMTQSWRSGCTEAEAMKAAFELAQEAKPGFSIFLWLATFIPADPRTPTKTGEI